MYHHIINVFTDYVYTSSWYTCISIRIYAQVRSNLCRYILCICTVYMYQYIYHIHCINMHHYALKRCTRLDCFHLLWEVLDEGWMMGVRVIDHVGQMTCCPRIIPMGFCHHPWTPPSSPRKKKTSNIITNKQEKKKHLRLLRKISDMLSSFFKHTFGMFCRETSKILKFYYCHQ